MTRTLILLGSGLFWTLMMAALVRREVLPYFRYQAPPSYRGYLENQRHAEIVRAEITLAGKAAGWVESVSLPQPDGTRKLRSTVKFDASIPVGRTGTTQIPVASYSEYVIDSQYQLTGFTMKMKSIAEIHIRGR